MTVNGYSRSSSESFEAWRRVLLGFFVRAFSGDRLPWTGDLMANHFTPEELARAYLQRGWWLRRRRFLRWFHATPTP